MELLLNFIVWIRFFSWDQCCFNMRLIKAVMELWSPQTFRDQHLPLEPPHSYPLARSVSISTLIPAFQVFWPRCRGGKSHLQSACGKPMFVPQTRGIINCLGNRQKNRRWKFLTLFRIPLVQNDFSPYSSLSGMRQLFHKCGHFRPFSVVCECVTQNAWGFDFRGKQTDFATIHRAWCSCLTGKIMSLKPKKKLRHLKQIKL